MKGIHMQLKRVKLVVTASAVVFGLALGATGSATAAPAATKTLLKGVKITVASKDFTESIVLSKIVKQLILANGGQVVDKTNIKGSVTTREAMLKGSVDLYWEYTGTAWFNYLKQTSLLAPAALFAKVKAGDKANKVTWLPMTSFNDTYAFAMTQDKAKQYGITKISQLSKVPAADQIWCVESEFQSRPDGWTGVKAKYGVTEKELKVLDTGAIYKATADGQCTFGEVFATDGRIGALKLVVLDDDKNYFPPYNAAITMPDRIAKKYPKLVKLLAPIAGKISNRTMATLNARIDVLGEDPDQVAKDFLRAAKLIK
jgi:osmoprotectant transport system substrate-binding protein